MEKKIKMMVAADVALKFLRKKPRATHEETLQHVTQYILAENIRDEIVKFGMIAAASEASDMFHKTPAVTDKEVLRKVMSLLPIILDKIEQNNLPNNIPQKESL